MNNRRILLVDDIGSMRSVIKSFLHDGKHELVDEACDGSHALQLLDRRKYAIVICDLEMPKLNGLELLKKIRATKKMRHVQFIMVTTHNGVEKIKEVIDAGVNDYIAKPFQARFLLNKVDNAFAQRRLGIEQEKRERAEKVHSKDTTIEETIKAVEDTLDEFVIDLDVGETTE